MHREREKRKPFLVAFSLDHEIYMLVNVNFNLQTFLLGKEYKIRGAKVFLCREISYMKRNK